MGNELLTGLGNHIKNQLPEERADNFHEQYCALIKKSDTSDVWRQFAIWLLVDPQNGVLRFTDPDTTLGAYEAIMKVAQLYIDECKDIDVWCDSEKYAWKASVSYTDTATLIAATVCAAEAASFYSKDFSYASMSLHSAAEAAASFASDGKLSAIFDAAYDVHYERMADKLIELLKNAPMMHETQRTHCKTIANKLGDLINKQESMVDNMDNAVESVNGIYIQLATDGLGNPLAMDNSAKISFSISHHNGTKHIMRGKEAIEKSVRQIEYALSVVKALLKDNPSDAISINLGMGDGTISVTYPSK